MSVSRESCSGCSGAGHCYNVVVEMKVGVGVPVGKVGKGSAVAQLSASPEPVHRVVVVGEAGSGRCTSVILSVSSLIVVVCDGISGR